jgi:hypothetical protein
MKLNYADLNKAMHNILIFYGHTKKNIECSPQIRS